jgi:hypothetical protein
VNSHGVCRGYSMAFLKTTNSYRAPRWGIRWDGSTPDKRFSFDFSEVGADHGGVRLRQAARRDSRNSYARKVHPLQRRAIGPRPNSSMATRSINGSDAALAGSVNAISRP